MSEKQFDKFIDNKAGIIYEANKSSVNGILEYYINKKEGKNV